MRSPSPGHFIVEEEEILAEEGKFVADLGLDPSEVTADEIHVYFTSDGACFVKYSQYGHYDPDTVKTLLERFKV